MYASALRRTGGRADLAQDAAQIVFIKVARDPLRISRLKSAAGWLFQAARFAARDLMRSEQRRVVREQRAGLTAEPAEPSPVLPHEDLRPVIDGLLDGLSAADREIVLLRYLEETPLDEIARKLEIDEGAARKRAERALERMRRQIANRAGQGSAASLVGFLAEQGTRAVPPAVLPAVIHGSVAAALSQPTLSAFGPALEALQAAGGIAGIVALLSIGAAVFELAGERRDRRTLVSARETKLGAATLLASRERASASGADGARMQGRAQPARAQSAAQNLGVAARERGARFLAAHPEMQRLIESESQDHVGWWHAAVGRRIGLSSDQIAKWNELCVQEGGQAVTIGDTATSMTVDQSLGHLSHNEFLEQQAEVLGSDGLARYHAYQRTQVATDLAGGLAATLTALGDPLTSEQVQGIAAAAESASQEWKAGADMKAANLDWDVLAAQAGQILSPAQMEAFNAMRVQHTANAAADQYTQVLLAQVKAVR